MAFWYIHTSAEWALFHRGGVQRPAAAAISYSLIIFYLITCLSTRTTEFHIVRLRVVWLRYVEKSSTSRPAPVLAVRS